MFDVVWSIKINIHIFPSPVNEKHEKININKSHYKPLRVYYAHPDHITASSLIHRPDCSSHRPPATTCYWHVYQGFIRIRKRSRITAFTNHAPELLILHPTLIPQSTFLNRSVDSPSCPLTNHVEEKLLRNGLM